MKVSSGMAIGAWICLLLLGATISEAQRPERPGRSKEVDAHPQEIGAAGIAWYTTWETGLAEAKRTNRPIFFMSAATCSSGISGVF